MKMISVIDQPNPDEGIIPPKRNTSPLVLVESKLEMTSNTERRLGMENGSDQQQADNMNGDTLLDYAIPTDPLRLNHTDANEVHHHWIIDENDDPWLKRVKSIRKAGVYDELKRAVGRESKLAQDVAKDVPRSFGGKASTDEEQNAMAEVLTAFGCYDAGEGYTQGMGFIVCFALRRQGDFGPVSRENAFWLLVDASRRVPEGFFSRAAHDEILVFEEIVAQYAPAIKNHLGDELLSALCYLIPRWFLSFFVFTMPDQMTLRLWNEFLFPYPKDSASPRLDLVIRLHQIAFALLETHSSRLLSEVRVVEHALDRISKKYTGSIIEAELISHRDARVGMEFMQNIVEATIRDANIARLVGLVRESPIDVQTLSRLRVSTLHHHLNMQRTVKLVIKIQRWYRLAKRKRRHRRHSGGSVSDFFTNLACAGGGRRSPANGGCGVQ